MHHRYSARKRVTCAVTLSCEGLVGVGQVMDLSVPGCLSETGIPLQHGQFLQLRLTLCRTVSPRFGWRWRPSAGSMGIRPGWN